MSDHELYFVLDQLKTRHHELIHAFSSMASDLLCPSVTSACCFYRPESGVALLRVRFASNPRDMSWTSAIADAGVAILDPARLSPQDRREFETAYLPSYPQKTTTVASAEAAIANLAAGLGLTTRAPAPHRSSPPTLGATAPGTQPAASLSVPHRSQGGTSSPPRAAAEGKGRKRSPRPATMPATPNARAASGLVTHAGGTPVNGHPALNVESLETHFLRGENWKSCRLRSLNINGACFATSAPPRVDDLIHVSIRFGEHAICVPAQVRQVTSREELESTGAMGFRVRFVAMDDHASQRLEQLLRAAHAAQISIKPPPPRAALRYPVSWPVRIATGAGYFSTSALDLSASGLFFACDDEIKNDEIFFLFPIDVFDAPVSGRARICRRVEPSTAQRRGLVAGYGVQISAADTEDMLRYRRFLARIGRRSQKRVVVAAAPTRARELSAGLSAAGYSVVSGSDPEAIVRLSANEPSPPDAALVDRSLAGGGNQFLRSVWSQQSVPCIAVDREAPENARALVDQELLRDD